MYILRQLVLNKNAALALTSLLCVIFLAAPTYADAIAAGVATAPGNSDNFSQSGPVMASGSAAVSGPGYSASVAGFANLASGSVGLAASASGPGGVLAQGDVRFGDVLTFSGGGQVVFVFHSSGAISGPARVQGALSWNHPAGAGFGTLFSTYNGTGVYDDTQTRTLAFAAGVSTVSIGIAAQNSIPVENSSFNFLNTFSVQIILPPGMTFTSESGVFLTQPPGGAPVPEPGTMLLLGTGLVGVAAKAGRRRK